ncbi:MAG: hypothetical protein EOO68_25725 [Moraxellaceae bacterium]|nr:MAG: hypothetical protein EOO68_25725 [Moraxellaceae bacterium]
MTILQAFIIITAVVGLLAADYFYAVAIISSLIFEKTMSWEMDQINIDVLEKNAKLLVSGRVRNMLQMHQENLE